MQNAEFIDVDNCQQAFCRKSDAYWSINDYLDLTNQRVMATNYQLLYQQLGHLFYAIAACDGKVQAAETDRLHNLVTQYWVPLEGTVDEFSTDAAHYILTVFDHLVAESVPPSIAFEVFADYYRHQPNACTSAIKHRISDTAGSIAHAFRAINKGEHKYLYALNELLTDKSLVNQVHG